MSGLPSLCWAGFLATALFGGIWGALLARVAAELWPLGPAVPLQVPCWLFTPVPAIVLGLGGAFGALLLCGRRACAGSQGTVRSGGLQSGVYWASGRATAALSWPLALGLFYLVQPLAAPLWGVGGLIASLGGALWLRKQALQPATSEPKAAWPVDRTRVRLAWNLLVFVLPLALYVGTLAPSVLPGDSGEFQFVAPMLGIPHPTGYPLYLLLGKLISLAPLQSVAYRLNLLSAVAAAGAVWAVYRCGRALSMRRLPALLGASLLALSETFWSQATIAEKYTLNAFFVALTLWLGLQWRQARLADRTSSGSLPADRLLSAWAFSYGLSLTHHRTMLLFAPAYIYLAWSTSKRASGGLQSRPLVVGYVRLALLVLAPLALYLLLPVFSARQPPYAYIRVDSVRAFWDLVLARDYQGALFQGGWASLPGRLAELARLAPRQFGPVGLAAAIAGCLIFYRRQKHVARVLIAGIVAQALFALNYYVPNTAVYYLPAYVWLSVCVPPAIDAVLTALARQTFGQATTDPEVGQKAQADGGPESGGAKSESNTAPQAALPLAARSVWPHLALVFILIVSAWPMALLAARLPGMDRRPAYRRLAFDYTYGQMAAWFAAPGALLVSDWLPATVLWYIQWVEGQMPAVQVAVVDPLEGQWAGLVEDALASGRPTYLARPLVAAADSHALTSAGPLVRVLDAPMTSAPPMSHPATEQVVLGDDVRLLGADLVISMPGVEGEVYAPSGDAVQGGSTLHVTVYWQAVRPPAGDYGVTLRLVDAGSTRLPARHSWLERHSRHPVGGTYPTSRWQAGEIVGDYYELALPPYLPSGEYQLLASVNAPVKVLHETSLARFYVRKPLRWPNPSLDTPVRKIFDRELVLVGYDAPGELVPGETVSIALQWLVCSRTIPRGADVALRPRLNLVAQDGTQRPLAPLAGPSREPSKFSDWQPGALMVDPYAFSVPGDLAYIEVQSILAGGIRYRLPLRVASEPPPGVNFGSADLGAVIRLRSHAYGARSTKPGETVHLTLEWEAVRTMDEAYKVFVHVLGPNGLPIAQQDNEPVNGAYPTTHWQLGERISDPYAFRLPDDLATGEYPVEVGLYRISDLSRLPVLDRDQSVVDDKVFLTPLLVE